MREREREGEYCILKSPRMFYITVHDRTGIYKKKTKKKNVGTVTVN